MPRLPQRTPPWARLRNWAGEVRDAAATGRRGTRWSRASLVAVPALGVASALGVAMAQGVVAANFFVSGQPFTLRSDQVNGSGFAAFLHSRQLADGSAAGKGEAMARAGFQSARLDGLCAVIHQTILGLPYTLELNAGSPVDGKADGGPDVIDAYNLILEANAVQGAQSQFSEMVLGKTAHQVQMGGQPLEGGTVGAFGLEAGVVRVTGLRADAFTAEISGNITLPKLALGIVPGTVEC
ncbi:DUF6230 family protein [Actinokineospora auranticolor]|uniref:Cholesterol esterase n=1 Tax=Actinokineospora auranticolor TaxID=155976 RepID=A0A2S6GGM1_9PSEU|nr:DUF6230 family protein [Actinokineospora auranticolor]PPK64350.1 hypothetical protein CLV40_12073 [Actinokineospora auranticolor]